MITTRLSAMEGSNISRYMVSIEGRQKYSQSLSFFKFKITPNKLYCYLRSLDFFGHWFVIFCNRHFGKSPPDPSVSGPLNLQSLGLGLTLGHKVGCATTEQRDRALMRHPNWTQPLQRQSRFAATGTQFGIRIAWTSHQVVWVLTYYTIILTSPIHVDSG